MAKETKVPKKLVKKIGLAVLAQIRNGADAATPNSVKEALLSLGAKKLKAAGCSRAKAKNNCLSAVERGGGLQKVL